MFNDNEGPGVNSVDQTIPFNCNEHWGWEDDGEPEPCFFDGDVDVVVEGNIAKGRCPVCDIDFEIDLG